MVMEKRGEQRREEELSEIDRAILEMISQGAKNSEIADRLAYSLAAVKVRVRRLMRTFAAKNRAELAVKASTLAPPPPRVTAAYRVTYLGTPPQLVVSRLRALFEVSDGSAVARVTVRIDPRLAPFLPASGDPARERVILGALLRRLRAYLQAGIDLGRRYHVVTVESPEELRELSQEGCYDFLDRSSSRCLAAPLDDPAGGITNPELCSRCNLPPAEIRCENLVSVLVTGVLSPAGAQELRFVSAAACRAGQPLPVSCVDACVPGGRECWSMTVRVTARQ